MSVVTGPDPIMLKMKEAIKSMNKASRKNSKKTNFVLTRATNEECSAGMISAPWLFPLLSGGVKKMAPETQ